MRATHIVYIGVTVMIIVASAIQAGAGERGQSFEMAESGMIIAFPSRGDAIMSQTEKIVETAPADAVSPSRLVVFEMGESGQRVSYAMSAEQIAAEDAADRRRTLAIDARPKAAPVAVVAFELAESGEMISFPLKASVTVTPPVEQATENLLLAQ